MIFFITLNTTNIATIDETKMIGEKFPEGESE